MNKETPICVVQRIGEGLGVLAVCLTLTTFGTKSFYVAVATMYVYALAITAIVSAAYFKPRYAPIARLRGIFGISSAMFTGFFPIGVPVLAYLSATPLPDWFTFELAMLILIPLSISSMSIDLLLWVIALFLKKSPPYGGSHA